MTIILLIASGFFTGLGFLFRYLNQYADWLNWVGVGYWKSRSRRKSHT